MKGAFSMPNKQAHNYVNTPVDFSQPLKDIGATGKERPWAEHRGNAELLAWAYEGLRPEKAARLRTCAPRLLYEVRRDEDGHAKMKLHTAWFCRVRLCPVCQWRRSLKIYGQATKVIEAIEQEAPNKYAWVMLALTVRNITGNALSGTLNEMAEAWHRLLKLNAWKHVVLGTMRSTEVTHNLDISSPSYNTYHPHYHVLLCVRKSYFKSRNYLSKDAWAALWQRAARLPYKPQIWVTRVQGNNAAALAEVAKYASKPGDYVLPDDIGMMEETVKILDNALHRRRLLAWTGILKEMHAKLGLDDAEAGDLVNTDIQEENEQAAMHVLKAYAWMPGYRQYYKEWGDEICLEENKPSRKT